MISKTLLIIIRKILEISQKQKIDMMLMGGIAVSTWGNPRATYDIDVVVQIKSEDIRDMLNAFYKKKFKYDKRKPVRSIQNLQFITFTYSLKKTKIFIDLFLAKGRYFQEALKRKKTIKILNLKIPVIAPEDLILYKLIARRERDMEDVRDILILQGSKIDIDYMKKWAEELGIKPFLEDELKSVFYKT